MEEANKKETEYIKKYNSVIPYGYNIEFGGTVVKNKAGKRVVCFNVKGEKIKTFNSIYEASMFINRDRSCISKAISKNLSAGGYFWCYEKDFSEESVTNILNNYTGTNGRCIYQYDYKTHELIAIYSKVIEASKKTNVQRTDISSCLSGKNKSAGGYIWSLIPLDNFNSYEHKTNVIEYEQFYIYKEKELLGIFKTIPDAVRKTGLTCTFLRNNVIKKRIVYMNGFIISYRELNNDEFKRVSAPGSSSIEQYDLNGNYIQTFHSTREASLLYAKITKSSSICTALNNYGKITAYGYMWKYAEPVI